MSHIAAIVIAALLPTAFVDEIPEGVRTERTASVSEARARLIANRGERIFFRVAGRIIADHRSNGRLHFLLLDKSGATDVLVSCDDPWRVGDEVEAVCTAMQPQYRNPTLLSEALEVRVLGHRTLSVPRFLRPVDLVGHKNDFNIVQTEGVVVDVFRDDVNPDWTAVTLSQDDVSAMVWMRTDDLRRLGDARIIDAEVRVTGLVLPDIGSFYRDRRTWVLAASSDAVEIVRPPPCDVLDRDAPAPHRRRVRGRVLARIGPDRFLLAAEDGSRLLVGLAGGEAAPSAGDRVSVAGFPRHTRFCTRLSNALCRVDSRDTTPVEDAVDVEADRLVLDGSGEPQIDAAMYGRTIRVRGVVRESRAAGGGRVSISISSGRAALSVLADADARIPGPGSSVEATGACIIEDVADIDTGMVRAEGIAVALRHPSDLRILESPPWWTPARLTALVALLVLALSAILAWNAALRRAVARRGRELAREEVRVASATLRLDERTRLAVELHDTIAQNLTGAAFEVKCAARLAESDAAKSKARLEIVGRMLKSCRDEIRNVIWDLRADSLDKAEIDESMRLAIAPHIGDSSLKIRFNVPRDGISEPTLHALMRIVRELAVNAVRHGKASSVRIAGGIDGGALVFSVRDDGSGFDPEAAPGPGEGHFGLQGVRERIRRLGGTVEVESAPGRGTRIAARIPVKAGKEA